MPLEDDDYSAFGDPVEAEADDYSAFGDPIETTPPPPAVAPARRLGDRGGPSLRRPVPGADHPLMQAGRDPLTGQNIKPVTKEVGGTQYIKRGADVLNADTGETTADPAVLEAFGRSTPGKRTVGDVRTNEALGERVDGATTIRHKDGTTIKPPEGMTRYRAPGEPPPAPKDQARLEEEGGTGYFSEFARAATKGVIDTVATTLKGAAGLTTDDPRKVAQVMTDLARVGEMDEPTFQRFFQEIPLYAQINPIAAFDYRRAAQAYRRGDKAKGDAFLAQAQGNTNIGEVEKSQLFQAGEKLSGLASQPEFQPQGGFTPESITVQLGQGAGSMLALLPAGIFGRLPGVTAASVSAGAGEAMENAQREIGTSRRDDRAGLYNAGLGEEARSKVLQASRLGVAPGATDVIPIEILLERLPAMIPGLRQHARSGLWSRVSKAIGQTATQAGIEGGQEGAQQYLQNVITQLTLNPEKELTEDVLHSIAIGGAVGGMVQAPVSVVDALRPGQPKGAVTPPPPGAPGQTPPGMSGPAPEGPASPGGGAESGGKSPGGTSTTPKAGEGPQPLDSARIADLLQTAGYTDQELADLRARGELGAIVDIVRKTGIVPPKGYKPKPATPSSSRTTVTVDGKTTVTETGTRPRDEMDYDPGDGTGAEEISTEGEAIDAPRPQSQGERGGREAPQDELRADARDVLGPSDGLSQEADAGRTAGSAREDFSAEGESLGDGTKARPIKVASEADIAAVRDQANPEPTDGQKDALNYRAAHVKLHGLDIAIETPKGGVRRSRKDAPVQWETTMPADYGRIKGTTNSDGEEMDVTIGPNPRSSKAVIIDQRDPATGQHDEYKVILGTDTTEEATDLYEASFSDGSGPKRIAGVEEMDVSQLKDWLANPPAPTSLSQPSGRPEKGSAAEPSTENNGESDKFRASLMDTANRGNAAPAVKHENGRNYRVKKDEGGGYIGVRLPPQQVPGKPPSGLLPSYLRPPKGEKWTKEQAVDALNKAVAQGDKWGLWEKHEEAEAAIKAQEAKKTAAPAGPRVMVNLVGKDGLTDAERGGPLKKADDRPYFDELTQAGRLEVFMKAGYKSTDATRKSKVKWHNLSALDQGFFRGAVKPIETAPAAAKKSEWKQIGVNKRGNPVFEDERGVRSYTESGVRVTESVGFVPGGGIEVKTGDRGSDYTPVEEKPKGPPGDRQEGERDATIEGMKVGDTVNVEGRTIGPSVIEDIWERDNPVGKLKMARIRGADGHRLVLNASSLKPKETQPAETTAEKPGAETVDDSAGAAALDAVGGVKPAKQVFPAPVKTHDAMDWTPAATPSLSAEEAAARLAEWKAEAKRQGETGENSRRVILSLYDYTGVWSQPYREAGFNVLQYDIKHGQDLLENFPMADILAIRQAGYEIYGVLSACPCTTFASSGAGWWEKRHNVKSREAIEKVFGKWVPEIYDSPVEVNSAFEAVTEAVVEMANPTGFHVLENPIGRIAKETGLPAPLLRFDPNDYGDPYTKRTQLWGDFSPQLPTAYVEATEGSKISDKLRGDREEDKAERSKTPEGFAYAFFMANNPKVRPGKPIEGAPEFNPDAKLNLSGFIKPEPPVDGDENPADYETFPEISEEGPWDFSDLYPAPDLDAIARLDADGRTVFQDPDDAVEVSSVIEETMNELTMLHGDLRELKRLADLAAKGNLTGKNKKLKPATIAAEKAKTKETLANMLGELETVFGPEAAKAIDAEAKNRSKTNDQRAEGMAEDYGPTRLKDREPPAPLIKAADYSEAGEPVPKQPLSETKIVVTVDTETEQGVETAMSADWAIGLADKRLKALYKVLDCLNG